MGDEVPDLVGGHGAGGRVAMSPSPLPLVWATNMTVSMVRAAARRGSVPGRSWPASAAAAVRVVSRSSRGAWARRTSAGWVSSSRGAKSVNSGRRAAGSGRDSSNSSWTAVRSAPMGVGLGVGGGGDLGGGAAQRVFEQGEQELVLAVEVLVEAAQRLAGAVDDFLNGEVGGALFGDDGLGGVQEPLDALLGAQLGGPGRPFHRPLLPGRLITRPRSQPHPCSASCVQPYCTVTVGDVPLRLSNLLQSRDRRCPLLTFPLCP